VYEYCDAALLPHDLESDSALVTRVYVRSNELRIVAIQFFYKGTDVAPYLYGSSTITGQISEMSLTLGDNEYLSDVVTNYDSSVVKKITFTTSMGRVVSLGPGGGTTTTPTDGPIVGVTAHVQANDNSYIRLGWLVGPAREVIYSNFVFGSMQGSLQTRGLQTLNLINYSGQDQSMTAEYSYTTSTSVSTTIEDSWTAGTTVSYEYEVEAVVATTTVAVSLSFEVSSTTSKTSEQSQESSTVASTTFMVPANSRATGQVLVKVGNGLYVPFTCHRYVTVSTADSAATTRVDRGTTTGFLYIDAVSDATVTWNPILPN